MQRSNKTMNLVMTALMIGLIMISIMFIKIPIPFTQGYVHLGDAMAFLAILLLGWEYGAVAVALGACLGDLLGGAAMWAPWSLVIRALMAVAMGLFIAASAKKTTRTIAGFPLMQLMGMLIGGVIMVAGYYFAEGVMYGNWIVPLMGIPWNIGQFVTGMVIAGLLSSALYKTSARKYFYYGRSMDCRAQEGE